MAKCKIHAETTGNRTVKVYRDTETREYIVRLYIGGLLYAPADYFTDDRIDAFDTAAAMCRPVQPEPAAERAMTVCAYSRCSAAEVMALVQWAKAALERQKRITVAPESFERRAHLLATANCLLWQED